MEQCICHVTLVDAHSNETRELIYPHKSHEMRKIFDGKRSTTGIFLFDPVDSERKLFFVFPDLSIDIPGTFRLKIHCFILNTYATTKI